MLYVGPKFRLPFIVPRLVPLNLQNVTLCLASTFGIEATLVAFDFLSNIISGTGASPKEY